MSDPLVKRGQLRSIIGVEVDQLAVTLLCNSDSLIANVPATQFARQGGFDGARLTLRRDFAPTWNAPSLGNVPLFKGQVAEVKVTATQVDMNVASDLDLLNMEMPRNLFQAGCIHTLFDSGCGLSAGDFSTTANVISDANLSQRVIVTDSAVDVDDYYAQGTLRFTTGANANQTRTVKGNVYNGFNTQLTTILPFPFVPAPGDQFVMVAGCDKRLETCTTTFSNTANFRGFPFIPVPESTM